MFLHPSDFVKFFHNLRITNLNNPEKVGFYKNSRNIWERSFTKKVILKFKDGEKVENLKFFYADQNEKGSSDEAAAVKSGHYKPYDVGWLWTFVNGERKWLAKLNPKEVRDIGIGDKAIFNKQNDVWEIDLTKEK